MKISEIMKIKLSEQFDVETFCTTLFKIDLSIYQKDVKKLLSHMFSIRNGLSLYILKNERESGYSYEKCGEDETWEKRIEDYISVNFSDISENFEGRTLLRCDMEYSRSSRDLCEGFYSDDRKGYVIGSFQYSYVKMLLKNYGYSLVCGVFHEDDDNDCLHYHFLFVSNEDSDSDSYMNHMKVLEEEYLDLNPYEKEEGKEESPAAGKDEDLKTESEEEEKEDVKEEESLEEKEGLPDEENPSDDEGDDGYDEIDGDGETEPDDDEDEDDFTDDDEDDDFSKGIETINEGE